MNLMRRFMLIAVVFVGALLPSPASAYDPANLTLFTFCFYDGSWIIHTHNTDPAPVWWVTVDPGWLPGTTTGDHEIRVTIGDTIDQTPTYEFVKVLHLVGYCTDPVTGVLNPEPAPATVTLPPAATPAPPTAPEPAPPVAYLQPEGITVIPLPRTVTTTRSGLVRRARLSCARSIRLTDLRRCPGLHTR